MTDFEELVAPTDPLREGENLTDQVDPALGALFERGDDPQVVRIGRVFAKNWRRKDYRGQHVIQIVRDSRGQHPDAFQSLRAQKLFVEAPLSSEIAFTFR
ncbi:MAG TPA: hypothetical protein VGF85_08465 [Opitutaceae bacterium]